MLEGLTVRELIEELENYDDDMIVVTGSDYGDRSGTIQANTATQVNEAFVDDTTYSSTGYKVVEEGDESEDAQRVVILNYDIL